MFRDKNCNYYTCMFLMVSEKKYKTCQKKILNNILILITIFFIFLVYRLNFQQIIKEKLNVFIHNENKSIRFHFCREVIFKMIWLFLKYFLKLLFIKSNLIKLDCISFFVCCTETIILNLKFYNISIFKAFCLHWQKNCKLFWYIQLCFYGCFCSCFFLWICYSLKNATLADMI